MAASVSFVTVHTQAQVQELVRQALAITADAEMDGALEVAIFEKALDLLANRVVLQPAPQPVGSIDLRSLGLGGG